MSSSLRAKAAVFFVVVLAFAAASQNSSAADEPATAAGFSLAAAAAGGHTVCQGPGDSQGYIRCGRGCPSGHRFISYNPGNHASCSSGASGGLEAGCKALANLHDDLGWNRGHKHKYCVRRGYASYVNHRGADYKDNGGGWCYKGEVEACRASMPRR